MRLCLKPVSYRGFAQKVALDLKKSALLSDKTGHFLPRPICGCWLGLDPKLGDVAIDGASDLAE